MLSEKNDYIAETNEPSQQLKLKEIYYNCSECKSPIEILTLNENESTIEFKCINNNHKKDVNRRIY